MTISTFVFDLDGTLTDPLVGMADSINHALESCGFAARPIDQLGCYVGPPLEDTLSSLTGSNDQVLISSLIHRYRERYLDTGFAQNSVYSGVAAMLIQLHKRGQRMGVCTSKPATTATKILRLFELEHFFSFVSGGDIGISKSTQLAELLENRQVDKQALMIGDRSVDIAAAKSNLLKSAAVAWGYGSSIELSQAQPDYHFLNPRDIVEISGGPT